MIFDREAVEKACEKHKDLVNYYFENEEKRMKSLIDKVIFKLKLNVDSNDFYSLGHEIFLDALCRYDELQDFNGFLYSCLSNKFKTEMTRRNRQKRQADKMALSLEEKVGNSEDNVTIGETIADKNTIESEFFEERKETYSEEMCKYLSKLSNLQKEVLHLISIGFMPSEILEELHINQKMYEDCYNAIHSYRNTEVLL